MEPLFDAVHRALDETEAEYAQLPFFVRPLVRRGFEKRPSLGSPSTIAVPRRALAVAWAPHRRSSRSSKRDRSHASKQWRPCAASWRHIKLR
jgi:hypothetical protein